jgi:WD40 repeat protein
MKLDLNKTGRYPFPMGLLDFALQADEKRAYAACMDGIYSLDLPPRDNNRDKPDPLRIGQHQSYTSSIALGTESKLFTSAYDGTLQLRILSEPLQALIEPSLNERIHEFWSWQMVLSTDQRYIASVTGQYLAGGEDYSPRPSDEATVKLLNAADGKVVHQWQLLPSVQCVTIDPQSKWVAAANLMGDIAVYEIDSGKVVAQWRTGSFTSWGIIKSHCYIGGIFAITFAPDSESIYVAGMGDMRDPMAGNGKQLWQRFDWRKSPPEKIQESHPDDTGEGLMEALAFHPTGKYFAMGGRLRGGNWNVGFFDATTGRLIGQVKTGMRVTTIRFSADGQIVYLGGMQGQPGIKDGKFPYFGYLERFNITENNHK